MINCLWLKKYRFLTCIHVHSMTLPQYQQWIKVAVSVGIVTVIFCFANSTVCSQVCHSLRPCHCYQWPTCLSQTEWLLQIYSVSPTEQFAATCVIQLDLVIVTTCLKRSGCGSYFLFLQQHSLQPGV